MFAEDICDVQFLMTPVGFSSAGHRPEECMR